MASQTARSPTSSEHCFVKARLAALLRRWADKLDPPAAYFYRWAFVDPQDANLHLGENGEIDEVEIRVARE